VAAAAPGAEVDFLLNWRPARTAVIAGGPEKTLGTPTLPESDSNQDDRKRREANALDQEIRRQAELPISLEGGGLQAAVGRSRQSGKETMVAFSARNNSDAVIELLPPEMELTMEQPGRKHRLVSDPLPVVAYRMSRGRLESGERTDGVVVFERPASKAAEAGLQLRLAPADRANHPVILAVPFIPSVSEGTHE